MGQETIKIKYYPNSPHLEMTEKGNWIDLYVHEDVTLRKGEFALIPLGVAMQLPDGYEAILAPRSSTFKRYGIIQTNGLGIIDNFFAGDGDEWKMPVLATRDVTIMKGTRVCQFRILKTQPSILFDEVLSLDNPDRNGFGSTGV